MELQSVRDSLESSLHCWIQMCLVAFSCLPRTTRRCDGTPVVALSGGYCDCNLESCISAFTYDLQSLRFRTFARTLDLDEAAFDAIDQHAIMTGEFIPLNV